MNEYPKHLIDSHFHLLSMKRKGFNLPDILFAMQQVDMQGIDVGLDAKDLGQRSELFKEYPFIRLASGIGPWGTDESEGSLDKQIRELELQLATYEVVAIGEIGLDNYHTYGGAEKQERLLEAQLDIAKNLNKPVIFHNREADEQFITLFNRRIFSTRGIMHCFQGSKELAFLAVDKGFYLSFAGPLTYKANQQMQYIFAHIPVEHILLETDSPYLSPVPVRGKPNSPLNMEHIYRVGALLRGMELDAFIDQIRKNYNQFLGL